MESVEAAATRKGMEALQTILTRNSVRDFQEGDLPEGDLRQILEAARWAPSGHNDQPWRFHILRGESKEALARLLESKDAAKLAVTEAEEARVRSAFGLAPGSVGSEGIRLALRQKVVSELRKAGAFVVVCNEQPGDLIAALGVAAAIQNILLAAHALGYGAVWMRLDFLRRAAQEFLHIANEEEVVSVVPIGIPSPHPMVRFDRTRKELEEITTFH
jgi:nitroreductase